MSLRRSSRRVSGPDVGDGAESSAPKAAKAKSRKAPDSAAPKPSERPSKKAKVDKKAAPAADGTENGTPPPQTRGPPRLIQPHMTNAPLRTPRGSRVIPRPIDGDDGLLTGSPRMKGRVTTENVLQVACAHLCKVDPGLATVIDKHHCRILSPEGMAEETDPFSSLVSGILAQQVSGAAANSIKRKFIALFNEGKEEPHAFPTPAQVAQTEISRTRTAGLSQRKAEYIQGLAEKFASGELTAQMLADASDEEVLEKLTAVRGLGKWSVEMFMMHSLKRMDVLSTGDLGVQRGMAAYAGRDVAKLRNKGGKWKYMTEQEMLDRAAPFSPYRSLFMWYMWKIVDVDVTAVQGGTST